MVKISKGKFTEKSFKEAGWEILTYPMKLVKVNCPTDVYVYNSRNELCATIIGDEAISYTVNVEISV